jgi:hypothetical protein
VAFTSANFKNSPGIRPSAKNSRGSSRPIILRLNRGLPAANAEIHFSGYGVNRPSGLLSLKPDVQLFNGSEQRALSRTRVVARSLPHDTLEGISVTPGLVSA